MKKITQGITIRFRSASLLKKPLHTLPMQDAKLDAVAVSTGPGSYTGLRIGLSTAKGVCYGSEAKLISIPTLKVLCAPILLGRDIDDDALLCPMIDARRMEVFSNIRPFIARGKEDTGRYRGQ